MTGSNTTFYYVSVAMLFLLFALIPLLFAN